jgi:hypothetical protein
VNDEMERMWKEAVVANYQNLTQYRLFPAQDLNARSPEYKEGVLTISPRRLVCFKEERPRLHCFISLLIRNYVARI